MRDGENGHGARWPITLVITGCLSGSATSRPKTAATWKPPPRIIPPRSQLLPPPAGRCAAIDQPRYRCGCRPQRRSGACGDDLETAIRAELDRHRVRPSNKRQDLAWRSLPKHYPRPAASPARQISIPTAPEAPSHLSSGLPPGNFCKITAKLVEPRSRSWVDGLIHAVSCSI